MRFLVLCLLAACLALVRPVASRADEAYASAGNDDLLCANAPAGTVEKVPPPFDRWLVVVCAPQSQALVPVEGTIWFAHGSTEPVSILALPPAATAVPGSGDYNPGYSVRFKALYATEAKGAKRARAMKRLEAAMSKDAPPSKMPQIDRVFQLDAVSIIYDMRYNIYFYVANKRPRAAIACIDECRQALFFDILTLDEAKAKLSAR